MLHSVETIQEHLLQKYHSDKGWKFPQKGDESLFIKEEVMPFYDSLMKNPNNHFVDFFEDLSLYGLDKAIHSIIVLKNKQQSVTELSRASYYSYLAIHQGSLACSCFRSAPYLQMHRCVILWAVTILSGHWDEAYEIGEDLIASVNAEKCIIKRGDLKAPVGWFMLELYAFTSDASINKRRALYPENLLPYDTILNNWDTQDLKEIDKLTYLLSDMHLAVQEQDDELLKMPFIQLFPYEILVWLKLREHQGLKNPTEFSHPLMNTPIAKMFLDIKEPLPKPKELPYVKEMLVKLQKKCPKITLPDWI